MPIFIFSLADSNLRGRYVMHSRQQRYDWCAIESESTKVNRVHLPNSIADSCCGRGRVQTSIFSGRAAGLT